MSRRLPLRALALPLILAGAAAAASPAQAATTVLDGSFGQNGFAFTSVGDELFVGRPVTTVGPDGTLVSGVLTKDASFERGGNDEGLTIAQHSPSGRQLDRDFFAFSDVTAQLFDVRKLADGTVIAAGREGEDTRAWIRVVGADGTPQGGGELPKPQGCWSVSDIVVHPSGQIVVAWNCAGNTDIRLYERGDASSGEDRGAAPVLIGGVTDMALAPGGQVVALRDIPAPDRGNGHFGSVISRIAIGDGTWTIDKDFGDEGEAPVGPAHRVTVDSKGRPIAGIVDWQLLELVVQRLEADGDADPSFDDDGIATFPHDGVLSLDALGTDAQNRVLAALPFQREGGLQSVALVRLQEDGTPDPDFGTGGVWRFGDDGPAITSVGDPVGSGDGTVATFGLGIPIVPARTAVPAPEGEATIALVRLGVPKPPVDEEEQPQQQASSTPPVSMSIPSTSARVARTCLSRRSFTIRLRPKKLRSAVVRVAGKRVKVKRVRGRLTAKVDLRKMKQATFSVSVVAKDARGRTRRETRRYRTCRVGKNGPKVKGGSTLITIG